MTIKQARKKLKEMIWKQQLAISRADDLVEWKRARGRLDGLEMALKAISDNKAEGT